MPKGITSQTTNQPVYSGAVAAFGFASYLGVSWTWVIGMLFPALLLRDYGLWGVVSFALPNIVGATLMGFVLTPEKARNILKQHPLACYGFSVVTILFHLLVAVVLLPKIFGGWSLVVVMLTLFVCLITQKVWDTKGLWLASAAVWLLSICLFWQSSLLDEAWRGNTWALGTQGYSGLWAFIPAAIFGFALSPYLDITFLNVRAHTQLRTGRMAFLWGFGAVFSTMIVFSLCYGAQLQVYFTETTRAPLKTFFGVILLTHISIQIGTTLAWHGLALRSFTSQWSISKQTKRLLWLASISLTGILLIMTLGMPFEIPYLSFLLIYGTILPAYVLLKVIPSHNNAPESLRSKLFYAVCLIVYPLAWGIFILHHHWLIIPCIGTLILAFLMAQALPPFIIQQRP